jgi:superfamily II RNA helicase
MRSQVHYVNDPERGAVWERALSTLPTSVQVVALSATLRHPERFCEWLSTRRPTRVVQRFDRHVPLHFGAYDARSSQFVELFCTHGSDASRLSAPLYSATVGTGKAQQQQPSCLRESVAGLVSLLERDDRLPAIVFFMSRDRCVAAAHGLTRNLLVGPRPVRPRGMDDEDGGIVTSEERFAYEWAMEQHAERVRDVRGRQDAMYRRHLLPFRDVLEALPGFLELKQLLDRGVAYHHAGMVPVLREYVELLFQARLVKVVFATETLGVGINMPARTVVFAQLDKPTGRDGGSRRALRPDEFWQMAGRSGRRGMDDKGYVVYHPALCAPRAPAPAHEVAEVLTGALAEARSQLRVDPELALGAGGDAEKLILGRSLRSFEMAKQASQCRDLLSRENAWDPATRADVREYLRLRAALSGRAEGPLADAGFFLRMHPKQRKAAEAKARAIADRHGGEAPGGFERVVADVERALDLEAEAAALEAGLRADWEAARGWLFAHGYLEEGHGLTVKGRACAALTEGSPLVRGAVAFEGLLDDLELVDVAAWLAGFAEDVASGAEDTERCCSVTPAAFRRAELRAVELLDEMSKAGVRERAFSHGSSWLVRRWLESGRDVRAIAGLVPFHQLGVFVRVVMRVVLMIEELKPVLLGLQKYELHNRLESPHDRLLSGIVSNRSLYVSW